ncbi:hypothetical protein [Desulfosarcina sp.]|uniref:hypothetical protein n=1 Tax=Desulfosarcina sp. TaxID=2027861 RepID=UPI0029A6F65F|nr:hypothetical protein [Desulfosarcina sp.]MDX2452548.1 hypothetical protein [Desulfosarcina sp.]MDX2490311.1 hypothetical protein [Desulfosarcina sp.]
MKPISCLILCIFCFVGSAAIHPAMAQEATADPMISLTAQNEPLGDVLETITRDTGYRFNLNGKWKAHPVSATINDLPLEKGLKRLLRSLNHSIVWESDKLVTITVFGKADPGGTGGAISFSSPPQNYQEEIEPPAEIEPASTDDPEPADAGAEAAETEGAAAEEANREPGEDASAPEAVIPGDTSTAEGAGAGNQPAVE